MTADIRVLRTVFLGGPNMWTYQPVLEAWLDIGDLEAWPSDRVPGLPERLESLLPGLVEHACSVGARGGFLQRLRRGTYAGHILEHVVLELQALAGCAAGFGQTRQAVDGAGIYKMAFRTNNEASGLAALREGLALLHAAWNDRAFDTVAAVLRLRERLGEAHGRGPVATRAGGPLVGIAGGAETAAIAAFAARLLPGAATPLALLSCKADVDTAHAGAHSRAVRSILERKPFGAAIVETDARAIASYGLPYRRCRVGVVSGFAGLGTLDDLYIDRPSRLHALLRTQVDAVDPEGAAVLNADDAEVLAMAPLSDGAVVLYGRGASPAMLRHVEAGGKAVLVDAAGGYAMRHGEERCVLPAPGPEHMPDALRGQLAAALATAWALDVPLARLRAGAPSLMQELCI